MICPNDGSVMTDLGITIAGDVDPINMIAVCDRHWYSCPACDQKEGKVV